MALDEIYIDEVTWIDIKQKAINEGYSYPRAIKQPQADLLKPSMYLFDSGVPQDIIWRLIIERSKKGIEI